MPRGHVYASEWDPLKKYISNPEIDGSSWKDLRDLHDSIKDEMEADGYPPPEIGMRPEFAFYRLLRYIKYLQAKKAKEKSP